MRPPFRWFGSKVRIAPKIIGMLPDHAHYLEVFAGSAAVLFAKPRAPLETLNDVDGDVVNLFRILRDPDQAEALARAVYLTPYARDEYALAYEPTDDLMERARRFMLIACASMAGMTQGKSGWSYNVNKSAVTAAKVKRWTRMPDRLAACAARLVGVQIESLDFREVFDRYDGPGVCMFIDPPYHPDVRPGSVGVYNHDIAATDHADLLERLVSLKSATAVVAHYPHPDYDVALAGWDHVDVESHADNAEAGRQSRRTERIWVSHPAAARLFR